MVYTKTKFQIALVCLLLISVVGILLRLKYSADYYTGYMSIQGTITAEENGSPLPDVTVVYSNSIDPSPTKTVKTDSAGKFSMSVMRTTFKNATVTLTKEGFWDAVGHFNFSSLESAGIPINLSLKSGFGKEDFMVYQIKKGFNTFSLPLPPNQTAPSDIFKNLYSYDPSIPESQSIGGGGVLSLNPFQRTHAEDSAMPSTPDYLSGPVKLYTDDSNGNLVQFESLDIPFVKVPVAAGAEHTLATKADGTVWAWGNNSAGQLGNNSTTKSTAPVQVKVTDTVPLDHVVAVSAGYSTSYALRSDGTVWSWGANNYGQLGIGNTTNSKLAIKVEGLSSITAISSGDNHVLALRDDGTLFSWGNNNMNQTRIIWTETLNYDPKEPTFYSLPQEQKNPSITTKIKFKKISAGSDFSMAIKEDDSIFGWGNYIPKAQTSQQGQFISLSAGGSHTLAMQNGSLYAWGWNGNGQLGSPVNFGSPEGISNPAQVSGLSNLKAFSAGGTHSIALADDGYAWVWGNNSKGQLGNNTPITSPGNSTPAKLSAIGSVSHVIAGKTSSFIVKSDGTVLAAGDNSSGQLGATDVRYSTNSFISINFQAGSMPTGHSGLFDAKRGKVYYANNAGERSSYLVVKGRQSNDEFTLNLNSTGKLTPIANPFETDLTIADPFIIDTSDSNKEYSIADAIAANVIDQFLTTRTGPEAISVEQLSLSSVDPISKVTLDPGDGRLLKSKKDGVKIRYGAYKSNLLELPSKISLEDAEWAFWVDQGTLDTETEKIWASITGELYEAMRDYAVANAPASIDEDGQPTFQDMPTILFSKNGKVIPLEKPDSIELAATVKAPTRLYGYAVPPYPSSLYCYNAPEDNTQLCVRRIYKIAFNDVAKTAYWVPITQEWPEEKIQWIKDNIDELYKTFRKYNGPPLRFRNYLFRYNFVIDNLGSASGEVKEYNIGTGVPVKALAIDDGVIGRDLSNIDISNNTKAIYLHEFGHMFRDIYSTHAVGSTGISLPDGYCIRSPFSWDDCGRVYEPWEDGMNHYLSYLAMREITAPNGQPFNNDLLKLGATIAPWKYQNPIQTTDSLSVYNATNNIYADRQYRLSMGAFDSAYASDPSFFKNINQELHKKVQPFQALINATGNKIGVKSYNSDSKAVTYYTAMEWYKRQWGAFVQRKGTVNAYAPGVDGREKAISYFYGRPVIASNRSQDISFLSDKLNIAGEVAVFPKVVAKNGTVEFKQFPMMAALFRAVKSADGKVGYGIVQGSQRNKTIEKDNTFSYFYEDKNHELSKRRLKIWNIENGLGFNVYTAIPDYEKHVGIYGIVDDAFNIGDPAVDNDGGIEITPLTGNYKFQPKLFDITGGYFQTTLEENPNYGWNAGSYQIRYLKKCGGGPDKLIITKGEGTSYVSFEKTDGINPLTAPTNYGRIQTQSKFAVVKDVFAMLGASRASAEDESVCCECVGYEFAIDEIQPEASSVESVVINVKTNKDSLVFVDWGKTAEYGQTTELEAQSGEDHKIRLSPVTKGETYHFKVRAYDFSGNIVQEDGDGLGGLPMKESGDQTFVVDVNFSDIFATSDGTYSYNTVTNTINWDTDKETTGKVLYGTTYPPTKSISDDNIGTHHSVNINDLVAGQNHYIQIAAWTKDNHLGYSERDMEPVAILPRLNSDPGQSTAAVYWSFIPNSYRDGNIEYGLNTLYGNEGVPIYDSSGKQYYNLFTSLTPSTDYHYRIRSKNYLLPREINIYSTDKTFRTSGTAPPPSTQKPMITNIQSDPQHQTVKFTTSVPTTANAIVKYKTYSKYWNSWTGEWVYGYSGEIKATTINLNNPDVAATNHTFYLAGIPVCNYTLLHSDNSGEEDWCPLITSAKLYAHDNVDDSYDTKDFGAGSRWPDASGLIYSRTSTDAVLSYMIKVGGSYNIQYRQLGMMSEWINASTRSSYPYLFADFVGLSPDTWYEYRFFGSSEIYHDIFKTSPASGTYSLSTTETENINFNLLEQDITPSVELSWTVDSSISTDNFNIYRTENQEEPVLVASVPKDQISYIDQGIKTDSQYFYSIKSIKDNKEGQEIAKGSLTIGEKTENLSWWQKISGWVKTKYFRVKNWIIEIIR